MLTGGELIDDIDGCTAGSGELAMWWLGQHSFVVKAGGKVLYFDPFLSPLAGRQVPPLLSPREIHHADLIFGTHDHIDHIDRPVWPVLADASPQAKFVVPGLLCERLADDLRIPAGRFVGADDGVTVEVDGIRITGIAAAHEFLDRDPETGRYPYLGYVVEAGDCALYHAGDTCIYEGLQTKLTGRRLDVAFLPINGRDAKRLESGCIGNMTYQEAADLAGAIEPGLVVPAHWDMFASNPGDPNAFAEYMAVKYPHLRACICRHGECVRFIRPR